MKEVIRTVKVAAVQMESACGQVQTNLAHAVPMIEKAARDGAQLIVLPELAATGYILSKELWDAAETMDGPTVRWLGETSRKLRVYLGAGFAETDGKDIYNTYVLTGPDGKVAGRVRKRNAEAFNFKRVKSESHVIETELGRIGIGICADNQFVFLLRLMQERSADMVLMPHAWPGPWKTSKLVKEDDIEITRRKVRDLPLLYAGLLGVPAVFVNQVGEFGGMPGILGKFMDPDVFRLQGLSRIIDADGAVKGELGDGEGVLLADVTLDPARKVRVEPENHGGWLLPGLAVVRKVIIPLDIGLGKLRYALSVERRRKARRIARAARSLSG